MADQKNHLCVRADESYTVEQFIARSDMGKSALRHAELAGLRVVFVSRRKYIRGAAWLEFLEAKEKEQDGVGRVRQRQTDLNDEDEE